MPPSHPPSFDEPAFAPGAPPLYNVVYCSRAVASVDDAVVQQIVATARLRNPQHGITGMLVFGGSVFFQWLEGPRERVSALMALIRADSRHDNIVELSAVEEVRERLFPEWDMELVTAEHIREVLEDAMDNAADVRNAQALAGLLSELDKGRLEPLGGS
jgi:hypothetical protein